MNIFKADLRAARIDPVDGRGQRTDFHALRHTLATNLALAGTAPRAAMEVMRHSDMRLTSKTYTDAGLLPLADAVTKLPSFADSDAVNSQRDSQSLFRRSRSPSLSVTDPQGRSIHKRLKKRRLRIFCQRLSCLNKTVTKHCGCRVRTCDFLRVKQALYR